MASGPRYSRQDVGIVRAAQNEPADLETFAGKWRRVEGQGPDELVVREEGGKLDVRWGKDARYHDQSFDNINGKPKESGVWVGTGLAPGGKVTSVTEERLEGGKLTSVELRKETPAFWGGWIPSQLESEYSLELKDGRLVRETQSTMYRKSFIFFGPFATKTDWSISNLGDPNRPRQTAVYERVA